MIAIIIHCLSIYASLVSPLQSEEDGVCNDARDAGIYATMGDTGEGF